MHDAHHDYNGIKLVGAGFGRTGTMSLMQALEILYHPFPCYHMKKIIIDGGAKHAKFWNDCCSQDTQEDADVDDSDEANSLSLAKSKDKNKNKNKEDLPGFDYDFDEVFGGNKYAAAVDFPVCTFYKEIQKKYNCKVILTTRNSESWYKSAKDTILVVMPGCPWIYFGLKILDKIGFEPLKGFRKLHTEVIMRKSFGAKSPSLGNFDKKSLITAFENNERDVKEHCKKNHIDLLVYEIGAGWGPLCKFLDMPIPDVPYPKTNDTAEFKRVLNFLNLLGWAIVTAPTVGLASFMYTKYIRRN